MDTVDLIDATDVDLVCARVKFRIDGDLWGRGTVIDTVSDKVIICSDHGEKIYIVGYTDFIVTDACDENPFKRFWA